jgi:hypothetical protein
VSFKINNLFLLLILIITVNPAFAANKQPVDAVVIMDSSGSMKKTDPKELRKPAAKLFITLLGKEDKLSVMSFSSQAWPITFLTQLNTRRNKDKALYATDKISSKGVYTNIHAAIERAIDLLKNSARLNRDPIIVLMSDGKMDVGNKQRSTELRRKVLEEQIPRLKQLNIKVYSVAFTKNSDQTLLQEVADATDGRYALAASDDVLHKVFAKIFEQSKEPNMLPLNDNNFVVDPSIREITIIANKKTPASKILLKSPKGKKYSAKTNRTNIKWFTSSSFDMITLTKPEQGEWNILFSDNDNKAYIVADIKLRSQFEYNTQSHHPELTIKTWFIKDDNIISKGELINNLDLELEIEHPDGETENARFTASNEKGVFETLFKPTMNGIYAATVIGTSKTFQRQQFFSFRAKIPKQAPPEPEPIPEPVAEPEPTPTEPPVEPTPVEPEPEPESDLIQALIVFLVGNLILVFIGLNIFFILKLKKKKS